MSDSLMSNFDTGTRNINNKGAGAFPVSFGYYPEEGSRAITLQWNFQQQNFFVEDLSQLVAMGVETSIQAGFCDNSRNGYAVTFTVQGSSQAIQVPAWSQGVFPLFFTGTPMLQINCPVASNGVTALTLLNVPINAADFWPATLIGTPPNDIAFLSQIGITGTTLIRAGVGRLVRVSVTTAITGGTVTFDDAAATGTANTFFELNATSGLQGAVFTLAWPVVKGIAINYAGAAGTLAISYT